MLFSANGRIRRRDYWIWMIGKTVGLALLLFISIAILSFLHSDKRTTDLFSMIIVFVIIVLFAGTNICLTVKRWHDRNKSGLMYLILFIPVLGVAWTVIECGLVDGTQGRNRFGKSPKGIGAEPAVF